MPKLIEVAMPLEAINAASVREKSIRHGHPSTLHLWWARRPLAACRAVLFAQLVDDPSSHPDQFPTEDAIITERQRLFGIIEKLVKWENSTNEGVLNEARDEIRKSCGEVLPSIYDPFSGGCSIPLEAQRLGLPAYGSDLNPVAVMIGKAMIEIPPKFKNLPPAHPGIKDRNEYRNAEGLAEDVRYYGAWMREKAWERIGHLYPQVDLPQAHGGGKGTVIAWIWARTVSSPDPAFAGAHTPLISSFVLSAYAGREVIIVPSVDKNEKTIHFAIKDGPFQISDFETARLGTMSSKAKGFSCLYSNSSIPRDYVRDEAKAGRLGQKLIAIVAEGNNGRVYCSPSELHKGVLNHLQDKIKLEEIRETILSGKVPTRAEMTGGICSAYGLSTWGDLFTDRQLNALLTFSDLFPKLQKTIEADATKAGWSDDGLALASGGKGARAYAEAVSVYLAFAVDRLADAGSTICTWDSSRTTVRNTFSRQAIPMTWDFAEGNPFSSSTGNWSSCCEWIWKVINKFKPEATGIQTQQDAQAANYKKSIVISTDPPYYDNIAYSILSDFFYCWLRLNLRAIYPTIFDVLSTPKTEELIAIASRHGGKEGAEQFFIEGMTQVIRRMAEHNHNDYPATIYYAFKQSEIKDEGISSTGWATFLEAVISAGYAVVGTWPMRTEMANRLVASGTNALANSVVLVCRKRATTAKAASRAEFIRALKAELPKAIAALQAANIAPADMPQSAIGPGIGVFSRYKVVLESGDHPMSVKTALQLINHELDDYLGGIEGEFDADTRFAITWFAQNGMEGGEYGKANSIAQARGISVESVKHAGIVASVAGQVRILRREELAAQWDPEQEGHLTVWLCCQHLVRSHEKEGVSRTTLHLLRHIGDKAEAVKDLAYCLYDISANKRQDSKEALAYNALIADWSELLREAAKHEETPKEQFTLGLGGSTS